MGEAPAAFHLSGEVLDDLGAGEFGRPRGGMGAPGEGVESGVVLEDEGGARKM